MTTITIQNAEGNKSHDVELSQRTYDWLMAQPDPAAALNEAMRFTLNDPVRKADFLRELRKEEKHAVA